jgi:hypothetical protein
MKSNEIIDMFPEQVKSGKVFIFDELKDTKNPEIVQVPVAQARVNDDGASLINTLLEGVANVTRIRMDWIPMSKTAIAKYALKPGKYFGEELAKANPAFANVNLEVTDYTQATNADLYKSNVETPAANGVKGATPKVNPKTGEIVEYGGLPVYRNTRLVVGSVFDTILNKGVEAAENKENSNETTADALINQ